MPEIVPRTEPCLICKTPFDPDLWEKPQRQRDPHKRYYRSYCRACHLALNRERYAQCQRQTRVCACCQRELPASAFGKRGNRYYLNCNDCQRLTAKYRPSFVRLAHEAQALARQAKQHDQ